MLCSAGLHLTFHDKLMASIHVHTMACLKRYCLERVGCSILTFEESHFYLKSKFSWVSKILVDFTVEPIGDITFFVRKIPPAYRHLTCK